MKNLFLVQVLEVLVQDLLGQLLLSLWQLYASWWRLLGEGSCSLHSGQEEEQLMCATQTMKCDSVDRLTHP